PPRRERPRQTLTLIVTTLALAGSGERHWNEQRALFDHVDRPLQARPARRCALRDLPPSLVLERVHDALPRVDGRPADAAPAAPATLRHDQGGSRTIARTRLLPAR